MSRRVSVLAVILFVLSAISAYGGEYYVAMLTSRDMCGQGSGTNVYYVPIDSQGHTLPGSKSSVAYIAGASHNQGSVGVADFDNDNDYDIIWGHGTTGKIYFIEKTGSGASFATQSQVGTFRNTPSGHSDNNFGSGYANEIAVADFNNDGDMDFVITGGGKLIEIFLGNGDGTFDDQGDMYIGKSGYSSAVLYGKDAADIDGDGNMDLIAAVHSGDYLNYGSVLTWFGNGDGTFDTPPVASNWGTIGAMFGKTLVANDFENYGNPGEINLLMTRPLSGGSQLMLVRADESVTGAFDFSGYTDTSAYVYGCMYGDFFEKQTNGELGIIYSTKYCSNENLYVKDENGETGSSYDLESFDTIDTNLMEITGYATPRD